MRGTQIPVTVIDDRIGQRSETVRRANLSAIVRELHLHGPLSRSELGLRTGLTRSAVRGLIGELVAGGLASEERSAPLGTPGRPSPLVRPKADAAVALAFEITVDSLSMALVGFGGTVHHRARVDRPRGHLSVEEIIGDLLELGSRQVDVLRHRTTLVGVGVAVAGIVRRRDGMVRLAPNLGWHDVPLGSRVATALELDAPVWVANEADVGGLAEYRRGAAAGADSVLYVTGEVGVGGVFIMDGRPFSGAAGYAGEIGHMPVNRTGSRCGCGSTGCWETEVGERAMLERAGYSADGGREAVSAVIQAARRREPRAVAAMEHVATWLGIGLAGLVNIYNPAMVVLGGLFQRMHPLVAERMEQVLGEHALAASRESVTIVPGLLGVDAPLLGAAELALEPLLAHPSTRLERGSSKPALRSA
jgi:predicted NBD/HSP70 family sugar kinase